MQTSVCAGHYSRPGSAYLDVGFLLDASGTFVLRPDIMVVDAGCRRSMQAYMHHSHSGLLLYQLLDRGEKTSISSETSKRTESDEDGSHTTRFTFQGPRASGRSNPSISFQVTCAAGFVRS